MTLPDKIMLTVFLSLLLGGLALVLEGVFDQKTAGEICLWLSLLPLSWLIVSWLSRKEETSVAFARIDWDGKTGWDYSFGGWGLGDEPSQAQPFVILDKLAVANGLDRSLNLGIVLVLSHAGSELRTNPEGELRTAWGALVSRLPMDHSSNFLSSPLNLDPGGSVQGWMSFCVNKHSVASMAEYEKEVELSCWLEGKDLLTGEVVESERFEMGAFNFVAVATQPVRGSEEFQRQPDDS